MTSTYQKNTNTQMNDWGLRIADINYTTTLAQDTAQSFTVPGTGVAMGASTSKTKKNYEAVFYAGNSIVSVSMLGTAVVPPSSFTETKSELVKHGMGRHVSSGDVLSFITHDAAGAVVSVALFAVE